ncbi:probable Mitochondrial intermembrane space import and assembly protein 40 [Moesziomyces antarcticus]|nr:probable Mitochondrial intermembrane space import and assembly protein 40 [Moesziomyces antarcticus]
MLSGHTLVRSAGRTLQRSARNLRPAARGVATEASAGPSRSSAWSSPTLGAAAAAISIGAAVYTLRPSPIQCEPRKAWSDRMKPKKSKGDAALHDDAHARHAPAAAHDEHVEPAEETPVAIEVAVEESEEQTGQQSAYDPETGEINWDCPCLGGMAHGPCGEQFKAAFSCFVYSEAEPKGIDCVEKFKAMQDCFREHPDVYKDEIEDDEAANAQFDKDEAEAAQQSAQTDAKNDDKVSDAKDAQKHDKDDK